MLEKKSHHTKLSTRERFRCNHCHCVTSDLTKKSELIEKHSQKVTPKGSFYRMSALGCSVLLYFVIPGQISEDITTIGFTY